LQAKRLHDALYANDPAALARARAVLRRPKGPFSLQQAQWILAREYGFETWPKLKQFVELAGADFAKRVEMLTSAACAGNVALARKILTVAPQAAKSDLYAACACGEAEVVEAMISNDASLATRPGGPNGWQPLLYVCFSRLYREEPSLRDAAVRIARTLLGAGADPDAFFLDSTNIQGTPQRPIYGACGVLNHPALARLLLERGANPNDDESFYHTTEHRDHACLKLLIEFKAEPRRTNALKRMLDFNDDAGLRLMLEYGFDPDESVPGALHHAILRGRPIATLALLLQHGANINAKATDGKTPYAWAVMLYRDDVAEYLQACGASAALTEPQKFIAACTRGYEGTVQDMLRGDPEILAKLSNEDRQQLAEAAWRGHDWAVRVMLDAGFDVTVPTAMNMQPLHCAAFQGHVKVVELLLAHRPPLESRNGYGGTPLTAAIHGAAHGVNPSGNYPGVIRALLEAGASPEGPEHDGRPLRFAAEVGYADGVRLLLGAGANADLCDAEGRNAKDLAIEAAHDPVIALLENDPRRR
jgi:ankyrin repeat protein